MMCVRNIKTLFIITIALTITSCGGNAQNINENDPAPDFTLSDAFGETYTLSELKGNPVIIYFYPKANTSGCTKQACGIRDNLSKFRENNIAVLGISVDSKESIAEFIDDHNLNFPLLSDESKEVSRAYGVLNDFGVASRITFIIDKNGMVAKIIRDVNVEEHAEEVFKFASVL